MDHYYGVVEFPTVPHGEFAGRVYHFDDAGDKEIEVFRGPRRRLQAKAIDDASEWLDENEIEALSDGSW